MAEILINLKPKIIEALKRRAEKNGRSLEAEIKSILESYDYEPKFSMEEALRVSRDFHRRFHGRKFPDSSALIREDRDS